MKFQLFHLSNKGTNNTNYGVLFIGNTYCDDGLNKAECNFDGGDCCNPNANTDYCSICQCHNSSWTIAPTTTPCSGNPSWIGDNYCDDVNNNPGCVYDGGDCCGPNVNTQYCTVCQCLEDSNTTTMTPSTTLSTTSQGNITLIKTSFT